MSEFKLLDEAIEAVDGTVVLTIAEWDDGFTWEITVTSRELDEKGRYRQVDHSSADWMDEVYATPTEAGIAACEIAIEEADHE